MPDNLLLTHWLAEILNAAHIMYYQTVIDVKYSTPDNWRAIIIRLKSVVRR